MKPSPLLSLPTPFTWLRAEVLEGLARIGARLLTPALSVFSASRFVSFRWVFAAEGRY